MLAVLLDWVFYLHYDISFSLALLLAQYSSISQWEKVGVIFPKIRQVNKSKDSNLLNSKPMFLSNVPFSQPIRLFILAYDWNEGFLDFSGGAVDNKVHLPVQGM